METMKPAYNQALQLIANANASGQGERGHRHNLVFHGLEPDAMEEQMGSDPEFCRDVLETRSEENIICRIAYKILQDTRYNLWSQKQIYGHVTVLMYIFETGTVCPNFKMSYLKSF